MGTIVKVLILYDEMVSMCQGAQEADKTQRVRSKNIGMIPWSKK